MNRFKKVMLGLLTLCVVLQAGGITSLAAETADRYTYTVTFYAGDRGTLTGQGVVVESGSDKIQVNTEGSRITVTGLEPGNLVGLQAVNGAVKVNDGEKYYVKGIRRSGYDNNTVAASVFKVAGDEDYVVAYGIRGEVAAYTVNYQDASGNTLAPSNTFYGNVGDKPVVAFLYVDGYSPQAYNLTKTLVSDESQNVFTFVYTPVARPAGGTTVGETTQGPTTITDDGTTVEAGGGPAAAAPAPADADAAAEAGEAAGGEALQEVPEQETPRDLVDLDDEETPLANVDAGSEKNPQSNESHMLRNVLIGVAAAAVLGAGLYFFLIKRRRQSE